MFNSTGSIGVILEHFTLNITGSLVLTLLSVLLFLLILGFAFRMPVEIVLLLMLPLVLLFMAYFSTFTAIGGLILLGLAIIFALNYFLTKY